MKSRLSCLAGLFVVMASGAAHAQDPSAPGPFSVLTAEYCCADAATCGVEGGGTPPLACNPTVFSCPAAEGCNAPNSELRAEVYYPSNLSAGPFPLLVFLHGNHSVCYDRSTGNTTFAWPCPAPFEPIPSYRGYDYIGRILASHGYIVASLSTNGIIAHTSGPGRGIDDRAHVIDQHFKIWNTFSTTGSTVNAAPFASDFIGHVDLHRAGTMGHSRGGDGVVRNKFSFPSSPDYTVRAVLPIAPTNVPGSVINNVDLGVLLSYCDGDVDTLEGTLFFDRARYAVAGDQSSKFTFLARGGNHNFYNTVWTPLCWTSGTCWADDRGTRPTNDGVTADDATGAPDFPGTGTFSGDPFCDPAQAGEGRLTEDQQRAVGLAYVAAFFRYSIGGETAFLPMLRGDVAPPGGVDPAHVGYLPPEAKRRDLNRFDTDGERTTNTLGGAVTLNGIPIPAAQRCGFDHDNECFPGAAREAHLSNFAFESDPTLSRVRVPWSSSSTTLVNEIPAASRDVSGFDTLQFRAGVDYLVTQPSPVQFSVILQGASGSVSTSAQLGVNDLFFPAGTNEPTTVMNTVRLPLSLFTGANLADVQSVTFQFDGTPTGSVLFSDLAFTGQPDNPAGAFPSADPGDGKVMLVSGQGIATVDIPDTSLFIAVPPGQSSLSVSVFDGDQTGGFDFTAGDPTNTCYRLVTDGNKNGVFEPDAPQNEVVVAIQPDTFFTNNAYTSLYNGPLHASAFNAAANASFYRLEVSTGPGAPTATDCPAPDATKTILQGFKVKASGQVSIEFGDFSFMGVDSAGPFASPNPFTAGGINTTYNGAWDFYVSVPTVGTPTNVNFRDSDADFLNDVDNPGVADGANEEIQYLVFKTNGDIFVNSDVSGNFDFLSGANDDETQAVPSGGVGGIWRWRWNNVLTENNIHVWPPTFSPARAAVYGVPVVPLKVTAAKPLEYWLDHPDQIDDLLPIRLGTHHSGLRIRDLHDALCILDEMKGDHSRRRHGGSGHCNRCDPLCGASRHDGKSHHGRFDDSHFDRFHRMHGHLHGRHHEPSELLRDLITELLVAELNVALDASFGQDLTLAFVYGHDESVEGVLDLADQIVSKGVRLCNIPHDLVDDAESVLALLETINAGEVTFVSPTLDPATPTMPQFSVGRRSTAQAGRRY